jgi:NaMN:DMB phosphoribosyltransferase
LQLEEGIVAVAAEQDGREIARESKMPTEDTTTAAALVAALLQGSRANARNADLAVRLYKRVLDGLRRIEPPSESLAPAENEQ